MISLCAAYRPRLKRIVRSKNCWGLASELYSPSWEPCAGVFSGHLKASPRLGSTLLEGGWFREPHNLRTGVP